MSGPYSPSARTNTLHLKLGFTGSVAAGGMSIGSPSVHATFSTLSWGVTPAFQSSDVGTQISIIGAGASAPIVPAYGPIGTMLVTKVFSVSDGSHAVLNNDAINLPQDSAANVVLYREVKWKSGSLRFNVTLTALTRSTLSFTLQSLDGTMLAAYGMPVYLYDDVTGDVFGGTIDEVKLTKPGSGPLLEFECQCVSWAKLLDKRIVNPYILTAGYFQSTDLTDVVEHLIYDYCDSEGLSTSVTVGSPGPSLNQFAAKAGSDTIADALDSLVQKVYSSTVAYTWYVDAWRKVYFLPDALTAAPWGLDETDGSTGNALMGLSITWSREKLANRVYLSCSNALGGLKSISGTGGAFSGTTQISQGTGGSANSFSAPDNIGSVPTMVLRTHANPKWHPDPPAPAPGYNPSDSTTWGAAYSPYTDVPLTVSLEGAPIGSADWYWSPGSGRLSQDLYQQTFLTSGIPALTHPTVTASVNDPTQVTVGKAYFIGTELLTVGFIAGSLVTWIRQSNPATYPVHNPGELVSYAQSIPAANQEIFVTYQPGNKQVFLGTSITSINERFSVESGTGFWDKSDSTDASLQLTDAQKLATAEAEEFGFPPESLAFDTYRPGLGIGQEFTANLPHMGLNHVAFAIDQVTLTTENNYQKWTLHMVNGALIGDWRTAWINLTQPALLAAGGPVMPVTPSAAGPTGASTPLGQWAPYDLAAQAASNDALFPNEFNFGIQQQYNNQTTGVVSAAIAEGALPVTVFIPNSGAPVVPTATGGSPSAPAVTVSSTGGNLPGGILVYLQAACFNPTTRQSSPPSPITVVSIPVGTNTNSITINDVDYSAVDAGATRVALFIGTSLDLINVTLIATVASNPLVITDLPDRYSWGAPNAFATMLRLAAKVEAHAGPAAGVITSISGGSPATVVIAELATAGSPIDDWAGRVLSCIGRLTGDTPLASYNITAFDPSTGAFTLDRSAADLAVGDVMVVRTLGYDNSAAPAQLTDAGWANTTNGYAGLVANVEKGNVVRVIKGTNRGATANVLGNDATNLYLDQGLLIDATSVYVVEQPSFPVITDTPLNNAVYNNPASITMDVTNYTQTTLIFIPFVIDSGGNITDVANASLREMYVWGNQATTSQIAYAT